MNSAFRSSHYRNALSLKPDLLLKWSHDAAVKVHTLADGARPIFCFRGLSGTGQATALALAYFQQYGPNFGMIYVRKPGENSHGSSVETSNLNASNERVLVFVDDMINSGVTRDDVMDAARKVVSTNVLPWTIDALVESGIKKAAPEY